MRGKKYHHKNLMVTSGKVKLFVANKKLLFAIRTFFIKRFIAQRVYTMYTRINYKIVPVTSLNKYGTSGTE